MFKFRKKLITKMEQTISVLLLLLLLNELSPSLFLNPATATCG